MSSSVVEQTVQFSDLSRSSKAVAEAADRGPVTITRRDGETLILQRKSDVERDREGLELAARVMTIALIDSSATDTSRFRDAFPWVRFLRREEQTTFVTELVDTAHACASLSTFEPLVTLVHAWRSTAEAYAHGWTPAHDDTLEWVDSPTTVDRPRS